jgi:hypothetical protein
LRHIAVGIDETNSKRQMENHVFDRSHNYQYNYRAETLDPLKNIPPIDKSTKFHISTQTLSQTAKLSDLRKTNLTYQGMQKRTEEMPVHPNLVNSLQWNSSTYVDVKTTEKLSSEKTKRAEEWTKSRTKLLENIKTFETLYFDQYNTVNRLPYINPVQSQTQLLESIRAMKREKRFDNSKQIGTLAKKAIGILILTIMNIYLNDPNSSC